MTQTLVDDAIDFPQSQNGKTLPVRRHTFNGDSYQSKQRSCE